MTKVLFFSLVTGCTLSLAAEIVQAADPLQAIVVESAAPVNHKATGDGPAGGAKVDLLSVRYHVHLGDVDLTKHADVMALEQKIKEAAKKGCQEIQKQYPVREMSDETTCVSNAVKGAMTEVDAAVSAAQKNSG